VPLIIARIDIYETYNPGAIVEISVRNSKNVETDVWHCIYNGQPMQQSLPKESRIFRPSLKFSEDMVDLVQITMDTNTRYRL
jgi:hypothetical protein